jgi:predicted ATPase/DNA-binding CsgD family transcriptional regulator
MLADQLADDMPAHAWWVNLAGVEDDDLVGQQAVSDLAVGQFPARAATDSLVSRLGHDPTLLVLDNCEQVVGGCVQLIEPLLASCPELKIIATSRQPLGAPDEQLFRVGGLPVDSRQEGAIDLFLTRARRHLPTLGDDDRTLTHVATICRHLDGMPLAIELAAARVPMMTVAEIAARLATDNRLLVGRASGIPARQRSLERALAWSYRLLTPSQQSVFRRLSVFRGSFSLEAAEVVAAGDDIEHQEVLDAIAGLVDQSLVDAVQTADQTRYRLLVTVSQYAAARLTENGEAEATRQRHLEHFAMVVARGHQELGGPGQANWLDRLENDHDNLRAAMAFAQSTDAEAAVLLAGQLWEFCYRHGHYVEGRRWLEESIANAADAPPRARAVVLSGAAAFAMLQCNYALAAARLDESLVLHCELGDQFGVAQALQRLGGLAREQGDYSRSVDLHEQSLELSQALGDEAGIADSYHCLGFVLWLAGDFAGGKVFCDQALDLYSARSELQEVSAVKVNLGAIAHYEGRDASAAKLLDEAIELAGQLSYQEGLAWALHERAVVAAAAHELSRTAELLAESLRLHWRLGDQWRATRVIEDIAGLLLVRAEPALAARLLASAESIRTALGAPVPAAERAAQRGYLAAVARSLDSAELASSRQAGTELSLGVAVAEAGQAVERLYRSGNAGAVRVDDILTRRESEVLKLLGQGRTNREIGAALFISQSTAGVHVSSILRKLKARSRAGAVERAHQLEIL